ncbi:hypothetical protein HAX54_022195, partial [Datura stramonium]|nr:hypothetical protein [Datura stramonium]
RKKGGGDAVVAGFLVQRLGRRRRVRVCSAFWSCCCSPVPAAGNSEERGRKWGGSAGSIAGNYGGCGGGRRRRGCGMVLLRLWCCCLVGVNRGLVVSAGCSSGGIPAMVTRVESEGFRSAVREKRVAPLLVSPKIMVVEGSGDEG